MGIQLRRGGAPGNSKGAFTFLENVVAVGLVALGFASLYALSSQCVHLLNSGRETVCAQQAVQDRIEQVRNCTWAQITDSNYLAGSILNTAPGGVPFLSQASERVTINSYVAPVSPPIQVTRANGVATVNSTNAALQNSDLLKVDVLLTWNASPGNRQRAVETSTVWAPNTR